MRKWLLSFVYMLVSVVIILLFLPLILGFLAEKRCRQMVEAINTTTPFSAKIIGYQHGWFRAKAVAQLSLDKLELPNPELYQLTITANIVHGPAIVDWEKFQLAQAVVSADIDLDAAPSRWLQRDPQAKPIATLKIKFEPSGSAKIDLDAPELVYSTGEQSFNWHGLKMRTVFSPLYNQVKSKIDFAGIDIKTKEYQLHLGALVGMHQGDKIASGLWVGERSLTLGSFSWVNAAGRIIGSGELSLHNLLLGDNRGLANLASVVAIKDLNINGATYHQGRLDLELSKVDQGLLAKLQQQLLSSKAILSPTSVGFGAVTTLLGNGSEINIKQLDLYTPWGRLLVTLNALFANQKLDAGLLAIATNSTVSAKIKSERLLVLHLLEKFYKSMSTSKADDPSKQAATRLNEWQQTGKIIASNEDSYLHLTLGYNDNQLLINDKQLVLTTKP